MYFLRFFSWIFFLQFSCPQFFFLLLVSLSRVAAERAINDSMADAKEGLVVSCVDAFETYKTFSSVGHPTGLLISQSLKLMPLYVLAAMRTVRPKNHNPYLPGVSKLALHF